MNKRVWTFQYKKDVEAKGKAGASHYVGWYDLDGNRHSESCGPGSRGEREAGRRAKRLAAELITGTHEGKDKVRWSDLRAKYERDHVATLAAGSQREVKDFA